MMPYAMNSVDNDDPCATAPTPTGLGVTERADVMATDLGLAMAVAKPVGPPLPRPTPRKPVINVPRPQIDTSEGSKESELISAAKPLSCVAHPASLQSYVMPLPLRPWPHGQWDFSDDLQRAHYGSAPTVAQKAGIKTFVSSLLRLNEKLWVRSGTTRPRFLWTKL